ncbi:MAG: ImmA/IrrE family metallo-endopeptidase [Oscillospiraceae bacterium]|nr:ImmA/IrrE family metallo-endopeptidase [Oscillospiraceae bacterium]
MTLDKIIGYVRDVVDRYGGRTVFETAENSGANVWFRPLGGLKGFYICENGSRYIVINDGLDSILKQTVCAHELGHDILHRELSGGGIREGTMFLDSNKTEREANLFAAELLISDKALLSEIGYVSSPEAAAYELGVPAELVEYKLELLSHKGYDVNFTSVESDFLK